MATQRNRFNPDQPEAAEQERRRDQPVPDAPATVPHPDEAIEQHRIHDSDVEDLGPEDFEEMTDEVEKTGIKTDT